MILMKIIVALVAVFVGIPNQIIDYKHRKNKAYQPGNAWEYYSKLSKEGSWEGRFMMWTGFGGIVLILILVLLAFVVYRLFTS